MSDIVMQVDIASGSNHVGNALKTQSGITGWWTDEAELSDGAAPMLKPSFPGAPMPFDLRVDEASDRRVVWRAQSFPPNWVGTEIRFELSDNPEGPGTRLLFTHAGFQPGDPGMPPVAYAWALILSRLKAYVETGSAQPYFVH